MPDTKSDRTIVLQLLRGAVPERADEISAMWSRCGHGVQVAPSGPGVTMNANATRILFDTKTIDLFWLMGFSSWQAVAVYGPALEASTRLALPLDTALQGDNERAQYELDYRQRIASVSQLITANATEDIVWPQDVPQPTDDREGLRDQEKIAAFDLVALALAFALLHEFRHVMYAIDKNAPSTLPEEELGCDTWAREFMMSGVATYARAHNRSYAEVAQKRATGIALGAVIVHAMTPTHAHWGNRQYPPIAERLTALMDGYNLPPDSYFWTVTSCLLIAVMRQENRPLDIISPSSQGMVELLIDRLR